MSAPQHDSEPHEVSFGLKGLVNNNAQLVWTKQ